MLPTYTRSDLRTKINDKIKGQVDSTMLNRIINDAVREVTANTDLRSMKRSVMLSLDGRNLTANEAVEGIYGSSQRANIKSEKDKYNFYCPSDIKGNSLIDIRKRYDKGLKFELTYTEDFLRRKINYGEQVAIDQTSFIRQLLVSGIPEISQVALHACDTTTADGTWAADGAQITAVANETSNYVEGTGALNFTTATGAMAGGTLTNSTFTAVDISGLVDYSVYAWVYIPMITDLTSFTLKWGSSASAYYSRTVTKNHDGVAFVVGWNLLRFSINDATETGTVTDTAIDYLQLTVIKGVSNTGTTGWILDKLAACEDSGYDAVYYSKYPWLNSSYAYLENSSADSDFIIADADELDLYVLKGAELASDYPLDDQKGFDKYFKLYEKRRMDYLIEHPSERMLITSFYQGIQSVDEPN